MSWKKETFCMYCKAPISYQYNRCKSCANRMRKGKYKNNNKNKIGALNPAWKGGVSICYYKRIVRENYPCKCQLCNSINNLLVHHKDGNRRNNVLSNLMLICHSCHEHIHKRWKWREKNG